MVINDPSGILPGWEGHEDPGPEGEWPVDMAEENPAWEHRVTDDDIAELETYDAYVRAEEADVPLYEPHPDSPACRVHGVCHR